MRAVAQLSDLSPAGSEAARVHVLHVVPMLRPGGMELALARVVNGLLRQGITHSVIALKGDALIRDRIDPSVRIHALHARPHDLRVPLHLRELIQCERPTVIHARNLGAWPEIAAARLVTRPAVPLVFSFHGVAEARPLPLRWRLLSRILARITSEMFTVSDGSRRYLAEHIGLDEERIGVIPNGVDTERFRPAVPRREDGGVTRVGTVGSLSAVKNQAMLVRACHRLLQRGRALALEIAGEGPERAALQSLIDSLGIAGHVRLRGHIDDTPAFLRDLDIFVLSSDSEAHPNALSEASASGLACIATRVGGVPEIVDQGRAALLFERGDEASLVHLLGELIDDRDRRRNLGVAARRFTAANYSMARMIDRYAAMYRRLSCGSMDKEPSA